ncbi:Gfo/Idh/MocA family protein [Steroidobacter sp.]|uniref:Gfo/Idh/MocA family protein n=1 Tax=Steroidobacter sp. TaxID=1978227 RepID=UPI001A3AAB70|nr:Gfo/Idh/MocA family oxidoreductase [Steroidobacter sp.]MBL8266294.1 Gfo/Idh/MocA family oxidoreductase [Steroidobacter sp.]
MSEPLRVGVIGVGAVAQVHLQAYRELPTIKVVAAADPQAERLAEVASSHSLRAYASAEAMLAAEKLDIACVLTPTAAHEEATVACARAGVNVLCEKPLSISIDACERMIAACREHGVLLGYGASYRFLPAVIEARRLIQSGALGDVLLMREFAVGGTGPAHRGTLGPHHFPLGGPGGSGMGLIDHGVHLIDTFSWLIDSPIRSVLGRGNIAGQTQRPEFMAMEFANGAIGHLLYEDGTFPTELPAEGHFSWGAGWDVSGFVEPGNWQSQPGCIHVHGTAGALRVLHYGNHIYWTTRHGTRQLPVPGPAMPGNFTMQMAAFAEAVRTGQPAPVPGEIGLAACRALLSVYANA